MSAPNTMPTPSDIPLIPSSEKGNKKVTRSVFSNYSEQPGDDNTLDGMAAPTSATERSVSSAKAVPVQKLARAFVHSYLSRAFDYPTAETWRWLSDSNTQQALEAALESASPSAFATLRHHARELFAHIQPPGFDLFLQDYVAVFGHAARGPCPLNEIEYGGLKADPLFQPHQLADLAAFYGAFGLNMSGDATERHDHIAVELEFMSVLAAKEAYALTNQLSDLDLALCRSAQQSFLRDHIGRWTPAFARHLAKATAPGALNALAVLLGEWIAVECGHLGVAPGSQELVLRPVNAAAESLCSSCGLADLPPGALRTADETT
jgi:putative dimethyl sulfoxide reductase chaperone